MADMTLLDALNASLTRTKTYIDAELAKKANSSHGTHVTWSTTTPKANGTAAVGSETKVARGDHVHPLQTTVSGNAGTATKLATARTLTIGNTGKTFDGSANVSWSLAEIGAAASSHDHTSLTGITSLAFAANSDDSSTIKITKDSATSYTDFVMSDDAGSDMWRWRFSAWDSSASERTAEYNLMTLKAASTTKGQLTVNGNVTADSFTENGTALSSKYAAASHTHNYAGSSSAGGSATSATKLATARTINGTSFDGTANITTANWGTARTLTIGKKDNSVNGSGNVSWSLSDIMGRAITATTSSTNKNKYTKFARVDVSSGAYTHCTGTFDFVPQEAQTLQGSLSYYIRTNSAITSTTLSLIWMRINNIEYANSVVAVKVSDGVYDLYYKPLYDWDTTSITNINCTNPDKITMYSNQSYVDSVTAAATSSLVSHSATAAKLTTARTLTIGNKGKTFDGSGNVTWSHAEMGVARGNTATATTAATAQWYRIAETPTNIDNNMATFNIEGNVSSYHTSTLLAAGISFGKNPTLGQLAHTNYGGGITKARIVYTESYSNNKAYLEVYLSQAKATTITVDMQGQNGWTLVTPSTVGSIPSGYTSKEITLTVGKIVGDFKGTGDFSSLAMSGSITLNNNNVIRSKTPADYTNTNSSTTVAAGTVVNLLQYNSSGNLHLGPGPYDAYLNTGNTYINSANNALYRTRNTGYHQFQINDTAIVNIKSNGIDAAQQIYAKAGIKSGGNIYSDTAVTDQCGTSALPWYSAHSRYWNLRGDGGGQTYGSLFVNAIGTTSAVGESRLTIGNSIASGTANNAQGTMLLYGSSSGHTYIKTGNNSTSNVTVTLPSSSGTLALTSHTHNNISNKFFEGGGTSGTAGYVAFAQLKITGTYANRPIEFKLVCRGKATSCTVNVVFANENNTDPTLSSIKYWGTDYGVFIHKSTTSTWLLYHTKSENYDSVTVVGNDYGSQGITITYPGSFITTKPTSDVTNASLGGSFGHASTATTLATARTINGTSFNGSANITTANWGTARNIYIADNSATNTGPAVSVNGSANATLKLPATIKAALSGNASTATKLATTRAIKIGNKSLNFDGSAAITYTLSDIGAAASSHTHNYAASTSAGGTASSVNGLVLWTGTQAQYDAISSKSSTTLYFIKEG